MSGEVNTQAYGIVMMSMTVLGFVVNVSSIILLSRKNRSSMFHTSLKILAYYDLVVIVGCSALYALPNEWSYFQWEIYPFLLPWLLPIVQIAMMSSVYCTVIMSFERYVRICHLCQLRASDYLTEENFKYYIMAFTLGPLFFYAPKFFEIRTENTVQNYTKSINCSIIMEDVEMDYPIQRTQDELDCMASNYTQLDTLLNVTRSVQFYDVVPTKLRLNTLYYKIYCIGLNSIFASVIPLASLFYLNICTILALQKMKKQLNDDRVVAPSSEYPMIRLVNQERKESMFHHTNSTINSSHDSLLIRRSSSTTRLPDLVTANHQKHEVVVLVTPNGSQKTESRLCVPRRSITRSISYNQGINDITVIDEEHCAQENGTRRKKSCETILETTSYMQEENEKADDIAVDPEEEEDEPNLPKRKSFWGRRRRQGGESHRLSSGASNSADQTMRKQENRLTRISLGIVSMYILCHIWRVLPTAYEALYSEDGTVLSKWPSWLIHVYHLSHTLIVTNSAINFLIYVVL